NDPGLVPRLPARADVWAVAWRVPWDHRLCAHPPLARAGLGPGEVHGALPRGRADGHGVAGGRRAVGHAHGLDAAVHTAETEAGPGDDLGASGSDAGRCHRSDHLFFNGAADPAAHAAARLTG